MSKWKSFFISVNHSESSALLKWTRTLPEVMLFSQFTTLKREAASNWIANTISSIWLVPNVLIEQEPLVTGPRKVPPLTRVCLLWAELSTFLLIIAPKENKSSCLTESQFLHKSWLSLSLVTAKPSSLQHCLPLVSTTIKRCQLWDSPKTHQKSALSPKRTSKSKVLTRS